MSQYGGGGGGDRYGDKSGFRGGGGGTFMKTETLMHN